MPRRASAFILRRVGAAEADGLTIQIPPWRDTATGVPQCGITPATWTLKFHNSIENSRRGGRWLQRGIKPSVFARLERALVEANRELMARFERKLQAKLAEIWGEEENGRKKAQEAQKESA